MAKMEIDLTDDQMAKVKELDEQGIGVGDAIDMLFEVREIALPEIEAIDKDETVLFNKLKDVALDVDEKTELLDENYSEAEKTYEMKVQDAKHKVSWAKDFFNF